MKRSELIKILRRNGCYLKREGANHSIWVSSISGVTETIPRHNEIPEMLAKKIIKNMSIEK
jgi:predicted RNA binding protein YcfA (HicA-like mRNA interferase family)